MSQALLDEGVMEHFPPRGAYQLKYGGVEMAPLIWLDDIINGAEQLEHARNINTRINHVMKQRALCLNQDKSVFIIMGSKKQRKVASLELESKPLMCGDFRTKEKPQVKWLGQILSSLGLADSVLQTVISRGQNSWSLPGNSSNYK